MTPERVPVHVHATSNVIETTWPFGKFRSAKRMISVINRGESIIWPCIAVSPADCQPSVVLFVAGPVAGPFCVTAEVMTPTTSPLCMSTTGPPLFPPLTEASS